MEKIFLDNKPKTLHFCVFVCKHIYFSPMKFVPINLHYTLNIISSLIIFIGYEDNSYHCIHHTQENIIFYSIHIIFDISLETKLSISSSFGKDGPTLVSIPHIFIPSIQNNPPTHSPLLSLFYKSPSLLSTLESTKLIIKIKEEEEDFNIDIQPLSSQ